MRKCLLLLLLLFVPILLSGCQNDFFPRSTEISEFEVTRIIGIDADPDFPDKMRFSIISEAGTGIATESGMSATQYDIVSASGDTIYDAMSGINIHSEKSQIYSYVDYYIFGEEAARENLAKYMDFVTRDYEFRFDPYIFVARGTTAYDMLIKTTGGTKSIVHTLDNLDSVNFDLGTSNNVRCIDVMGMLDNPTTATVIPALVMIDYPYERTVSGDAPEMDVQTSGFAVIIDSRLEGYIERDQALGYCFLTDNVQSCQLTLEDPNGSLVGLEVINTVTEVKAEFSGDELKNVTYKVLLRANVTEVHGKDDLFSTRWTDEFNERISAHVEGLMRDTVSVAQRFGVDSLGLGTRIRMLHPNKWAKLESDWDAIFGTLDISYKVDAEIVRVYAIKEPNGRNVEEKLW